MHFSEYDVRLAAYAVIVDEQRNVLLTWYNGAARYPAGWTLPGGGVEYEESCEDAVVREVHEETGYHVELGPLLATDSFLDRGRDRPRPFKALRVIYSATVTGGELGTVEVGGTTDVARWFVMDELDDDVRGGIIGVGLRAWEAHASLHAK